MNHPINSNIEKMNKNFWSDKKLYQIACMTLAVLIAGIVIIFIAPKVGTTTSSYICAIAVFPLAYVAMFNKNGLDFVAFRKARRNNVQNGKLLCGNRMVEISNSSVKRKNGIKKEG